MAMKWYLRACPVCGGDMHDDWEDPGWVTCFMCARSFSLPDVAPEWRPQRDEQPPSDLGQEIPSSLPS